MTPFRIMTPRGYWRDVPTWERWSRFLRQPAKVDSPMQRTNHHEDAETVFG